MVVEIKPRRKRGTRACQDDRSVVELRLKAVESCMQVVEECGVLRVDLISAHGHDDNVVMFALYRPRHGDTP
jgi:hypothetical protein